MPARARCISGRLSVGQLIVFISYLAQLYAPINQITQSWGLIAGARVGARRVFEVLDTEADLKDGSTQLSGGRRARRHRLAQCLVSLPAGDAGPAPHRSSRAGRSQDRRGRPDRRGQIDAARAVAAVFRSVGGVVEIDGIDLREYKLKSLAQPDLDGAAAAADFSAFGARQHRLREAGRAPMPKSRGRRGWRASTISSPRFRTGMTP